MQILIGTPTAGHIVTTAYSHSLVAATQAINEFGGSYQYRVFNGSDLPLARNYLAHEFLEDPYLTHLLFLDSDMLVEKPVFSRLLRADKPIVGAIYSERQMNRARYLDLIRSGVEEPKARAAALQFNVRPIDDGYAMSKGWCKVGGIGAGCLLIKRQVFSTLARTGGASQIRSMKLSTHVGLDKFLDFFGTIPLEDGDYLSEDYSFCHRALKVGFEIWGLADMAVSHMGRQEYAARFLDHLEQTAIRQDLE